MKKYIVTMALLALGFTACNKTEVENQAVPEETPSKTTVYQVSIPATMADTKAVDFSGTDPVTGKPTAVSTFVAGDKVYVYNETKDVMACDDQGKSIALTLTADDITDDGKSCTLTGTLSFHKYENNTWTHVSVEDTDSYKLLYNLSMPYTGKPLASESELWYFEQDGTAAGVADYAIATTTLNNDGGVLTTTSTVSFTNLQSMFRFKFIDESTNAINVKHLVITSKNSAVASYYSPLLPSTNSYTYDTDDPFPVTLTTPTTDYIYVALCIKESVAAGDELTFKAIDADGKVYTGTKDAPNDGFKNGKYYYNSSAITLTHDASKDITAPNIVWTSPSTPIEMNYNGEYPGFPADFDITLSGTSRNCYFFLLNAGTVRLNGINATYSGPFFDYGGNLTVELQNGSANTIVDTSVNTYGAYCIGAATLKLSGNGTLTVTTSDAERCGFNGSTNYNIANNGHETTTVLDVSSQLAAEGYSVIRSARTDNADGTYTWTYTVRPLINLSSLNGDYVAQNGDVLTGTLTGNHKISVADGATVTLAGVSINADGSRTGEFNGITCLGNATINLADGTTNTVRGMTGSSDEYSGIFVPHNDTDEYTLTIQGSGTLNAFGGSCAAGIGANRRNHGGNIVIAGGTINATGGANAAGIGSGSLSSSYTISCGNITISGGTVIANGGAHAAGIGSGEFGSCGIITISNGTIVANGGARAAGIGSGEGGSCGTITISGGTVTANGGDNAPGIGSGEDGSCGGITINTGVTKVTATKGSGAPNSNSIGPGQNGSCDRVSIGGTTYWSIISIHTQEYGYLNEGATYLTTSPLVYPAP